VVLVRCNLFIKFLSKEERLFEIGREIWSHGYKFGKEDGLKSRGGKENAERDKA
jgi:hypothetical protein